MRRLLQLGTWLLLLITLAAPLSECFDRWDAPGLSNDVEFAIFSLVLTLCLVLLVSRLIANLASIIELTFMGRLPMPGEVRVAVTQCAIDLVTPPPKATPLRI